jgi:hypothetical protein
MVDFDAKCRECGKPITLRVRDGRAKELFEKQGALCERCYQSGRQSAPRWRMAWQGVRHGHLVYDEFGRSS